MKTSLIALLILTAILCGGQWFNATAEQCCDRFEECLAKSSTAADRSDWKTAEAELLQLRSDWENRKPLLAVFAHHNILDEIQIALSRTIATVQNGDRAAFRLEHDTLIKAISNLRDSDTAQLANIF